CVRSGWARSRRRWRPASPSCLSPCAARARSSAPGRPCRGRDRSTSGSAIPSRPKGRAGARWWRCGTGWPRRSPRIARSRGSTWWRAARCGNETMTSLLGLADIERAQRALAPYLPPTPFVRATGPRAKVDKLRTFPITVVEGGETYDEAAARAAEHADRTGAFSVHAFDDPRTAAGQGTVALEILEQNPLVGTIVVPV